MKGALLHRTTPVSVPYLWSIVRNTGPLVGQCILALVLIKSVSQYKDSHINLVIYNVYVSLVY